MSILAELEEYFKYMGQVGFRGLALKESPFEPRQTPMPDVAAPSPVSAPRREAVRFKPKPVVREEKRSAIPDLGSIMDLVSPESSLEETRAKAAQITGDTPVEALRKLYQAFHQCQACALGTTRKSFVFGEGPADADLMFIGEGPGYHEDQSGRPFVGDAGQLLTKIILAMGFQRDQVFIANVVKCRPPGNRNPLPDEMAACEPILMRQIETIQPKVIIALGATAFRFFKGQPVSITRARGQFFVWRGFQVMPTYHPAYILRNPRAKRDVWEDVKKVISFLKDP